MLSFIYSICKKSTLFLYYYNIKTLSTVNVNIKIVLIVYIFMGFVQKPLKITFSKSEKSNSVVNLIFLSLLVFQNPLSLKFCILFASLSRKIYSKSIPKKRPNTPSIYFQYSTKSGFMKKACTTAIFTYVSCSLSRLDFC